LVNFFRFWYHAPRKLWQPWLTHVVDGLLRVPVDGKHDVELADRRQRQRIRIAERLVELVVPGVDFVKLFRPKFTDKFGTVTLYARLHNILKSKMIVHNTQIF
jgi:hypothetical protein